MVQKHRSYIEIEVIELVGGLIQPVVIHLMPITGADRIFSAAEGHGLRCNRKLGGAEEDPGIDFILFCEKEVGGVVVLDVCPRLKPVAALFFSEQYLRANIRRLSLIEFGCVLV